MTHPEPPSLEAPEVEDDPITPDELGVAALPADATTAQRRVRRGFRVAVRADRPTGNPVGVPHRQWHPR